MAVYGLDGVAPRREGAFTWVASNAVVVGKVVLEEHANVWFGAVLRGDNEEIRVGRGSNVQDLTVIHTDPGFPTTIGEDCTIGHRAILHGCTIASNTLIGMGAIILNGARIGRNCIVGAHALVAENKEIPDNSLVVGVPGRVVKTLPEGAAEQIRMSAERYVANARRFAAGLTPLED